jgi:hypothetical protein
MAIIVGLKVLSKLSEIEFVINSYVLPYMPGAQRISLMMVPTVVSPTHQVQIPGVSFISQICGAWMPQFILEVVNTHLQQLIMQGGTDWQVH